MKTRGTITRREATALLGTALAFVATGASASTQAPSLDGTGLPPVDKRLPTEPVVLKGADGVGTYGGEMRFVILGGTDRGYGWIGRQIGYEPMVRWAPEGGRVVPNIAKSWDINEDSSSFVFHLRQGMRWSDGEPVTADDVLFWYNDMATNQELFPGGPGAHMKNAGKVAKVEKVDDFSVRFTFEKPYGLFIQQMANSFNVATIAPAHYAKQFHPAYNKDLDQLTKKLGYASWVDMFQQKVGGPSNADFAAWVNPDLPTLNPWTVKTPYDGSSPQVVAVRNPYYWKVDTAGNQLPYADRVVFSIVGDTEVLKLMVMNGQLDFVYYPQNLTVADRPLFFDNRAKGKYHFVELSPDVSATQAIHLNLTTLDKQRHELFNNKDFRIALSRAIDRQEMIDIIYLSQGVPYEVAPRPESQFYDEEFAKQYTEFDPDQANKLLDGLGLTKKNDAGIRLFADGTPISIQVDVRTESKPQIDGLQLITGYWAKIGIELRINVIDSAFYRKRQEANLFEAISNVGAGGLNEMLNPRLYVPINDNALYAVPWAYWYLGDPRGIEPPEIVKKQLKLYDQFLATANEQKQLDLFRQVLDIAKQEFRTIGISLISGAYAIASNRVGNMPGKMIDSAIYPTPAPTNTATWYIKSE